MANRRTLLSTALPAAALALLVAAPSAAGPGPSASASSLRAEARGVAGALTLRLEPHSVRAGGFSLRVQQADGSLLVTPPGPSRTVRGTVLELPGAQIAGALLADGFHGLLIDPGPGPDQWIEAAASVAVPPEYDPALSGAATEGPRQDAAAVPPPAAAGADNCAMNGLCVADLVVDVDHPTYQGAGLDALEVVARAEAVVAASNLRYESQFRITHRLTAIVVRASAAHDPYTIRCSDGSVCQSGQGCTVGTSTVTCGHALLGQIGTEWGPGQHPDVPRDAVRVFTGQSVEFGGLSQTAAICNHQSGGWVQGLDVSCVRTGIHTHELGHLWGSDHTTAGIMINGGSNCASAFAGSSLTSIPQRRDLVDQSCLDLLADRIFADGFESGDTSAWSSVQDPGGRLTVFGGAGTLFGARSLRVSVTSADPAWVRDDRPAGERRYRARFYADLSGLQMQELSQLRILEATSPASGPVVRVSLRRSGGRFLVRGRVRSDDDTYKLTPETEVPGTGAQRIEIDWRAATAPGASDGHLRLWVNGNDPVEAAAVDNDTRPLEWVRLGALGAIDHPATQGSFVVDAFDSRRDQPIGAEP